MEGKRHLPAHGTITKHSFLIGAVAFKGLFGISE
jgi:hypothetical protein